MLDQVTVKTTIQAPVAKVWMMYTDPEFVKEWNNASPDWHTPQAENNLFVGGNFLYRMEAKDGSVGFDFTGTYTAVEPHRTIAYTMPDGRTVEITFNETDQQTEVIVQFDPEQENPIEMQQAGWQSILDNFKRVVEG